MLDGRCDVDGVGVVDIVVVGETDVEVLEGWGWLEKTSFGRTSLHCFACAYPDSQPWQRTISPSGNVNILVMGWMLVVRHRRQRHSTMRQVSDQSPLFPNAPIGIPNIIFSTSRGRGS